MAAAMIEPGPSLLLSDQGEMALTDTDPAWDSVHAMLHVVGLALRRARTRRGITQGRLAEQIGLSAAVLSRLERTQRGPHLTTVLALCNVLGVRFSDVMRVAEDEAFPMGMTPWTDYPSVLIGLGPQPGDVDAAILRRGGDA
jgi:DNA-binding XRE family transcriptional regulator